jgi:hypothetical protein
VENIASVEMPVSMIVDVLVGHTIKLDALEYVLKETNRLVHELYLGTIENLQAQKAAEVNRLLPKRSNQSLSKASWTTQSPVSRIPILFGIEISGDDEVLQATKGDDSVAWIGKVK